MTEINSHLLRAEIQEQPPEFVFEHPLNSQTEINSHLLRAETQEQASAFSFKYSCNPQAEINVQALETGVKTKGAMVQISRISPGQESFIYPIHHPAQEFVYILSGRGIVEIDDRGYEIASGDFIGFPTPSVVHHVCNPFVEDLIYLVGDERKQAEITECTQFCKGVMREHGNTCWVDLDAIQSLIGPELNSQQS